MGLQVFSVALNMVLAPLLVFGLLGLPRLGVMGAALATFILITAKQLEVAPNLHHLYQYLIENSFIQEISNYHREYLKIFPPDVLAKMQRGDRSWESMVPPEVAQIIKEREFFGYRQTAA